MVLRLRNVRLRLRGTRIAQNVRGAICTAAALRGHPEFELQALEADGTIGRRLADLMV